MKQENTNVLCQSYVLAISNTIALGLTNTKTLENKLKYKYFYKTNIGKPFLVLLLSYGSHFVRAPITLGAVLHLPR